MPSVAIAVCGTQTRKPPRRFTFGYNAARFHWLGPQDNESVEELFHRMFSCSLEIDPSILEVADTSTLARLYQRMASRRGTRLDIANAASNSIDPEEIAGTRPKIEVDGLPKVGI